MKSKKNLFVLLVVLLGILYVFWDWQSMNITLSDYGNHIMLWIAKNKEGVVALVGLSIPTVLGWFGITIKKEIAQKLAFKLFYIFGIDAKEAPGIKDAFISDQKEIIKTNLQTKVKEVLDCKESILTWENKMRKKGLLTEDEFNRAKELIIGKLEWLNSQGEYFISEALELDYNEINS